MDTGLKISAALHLVLILLAVFGGQLFRADDEIEPEIVTTVSLISQGQLAALQNPEPAPEPTPTPESEPEPAPPEPEETAEPLLPEGIQDEGVISDQDSPGELVAEEPDPEVKPEEADIITNEVNEVPDPVIDQAPVEVAPTETAEGEEAPEETQEAAAPEATTTEIITEAEEAAPTGAPVRTAIPRARPNLPRPAPEPEPEVAEQEPEDAPEELSVEEQIQAEIERALEEALLADTDAPVGNSDQGEPSPVPLTGAEVSGLIFNIQRCWSLPIGVQNAAELTVVLGITLSPEGNVEGTPTLVEPTTLGPGIQQAYDAAQRAVLNCQPYALPVEKYDSWRQLEIVFNPERMVNR
ncbi:MAG: hypothetical protein AAF826_08955 [Pseudomonadota bacterium]